MSRAFGAARSHRRHRWGIGSLDGPDRLLVNDGKGHLRAGAPVFVGDPTRGTLGIALADLDGDGRLDCVHAQGEVANALAEVVCFGQSIGKDTAPPTIGAFALPAEVAVGAAVAVQVRVHDRKSPCMPHDWRQVVLRCRNGDQEQVVPLQWYGEFLWRATVPTAAVGAVEVVVEAVDAAGNVARSPAARALSFSVDLARRGSWHGRRPDSDTQTSASRRRRGPPRW